ncbi:MAG: hypothetical protein GXP27_08675 [Planctomycetes bacterium]|nr:hypothetical protein [Planctomycetota bacterium]
MGCRFRAASGTGFSVGENGGTTATDLGLRTMTAATSLSELNRGQGVPFDASSNLKITRRDGTTVSIDLSNALTIQDVLDAINAVDPGNLVASLNAVGNGISLLDNSGTGPLIVESNAVAVALGLAGEEDSGDPANPLVGEDVNPREATGVLTILAELEQALRRGDDQELQRLTTLIDDEINRFNQVRAELGSRLKLLDDIENQVRDQDLVLQEKLSEKLDTNLPQTLTELLQQQQTLEATLALTAQSFRLSVLSFLT